MYKTLLFLILSGTVSVLVLYQYPSMMSFRKIYKIKTEKSDKTETFIEEPTTCVIPDIDPFGEENLHLVKPGHIIRCATVSLTYRNDTSIVVNKTAVARSKFKSSFAYCKYQAIYRPRFGKDHNYFQYLNESNLSTKELTSKKSLCACGVITKATK